MLLLFIYNNTLQSEHGKWRHLGMILGTQMREACPHSVCLPDHLAPFVTGLLLNSLLGLPLGFFLGLVLASLHSKCKIHPLSLQLRTEELSVSKALAKFTSQKSRLFEELPREEF